MVTTLKFVIFAFLMLWTFNSVYCHSNRNETLKLIVTIFRHGDRTNDLSSTYPNDPYINETYQPFGNGQLTKVGKERMFRLGQTFRKRYDYFFDNSSKQLYTLSTDFTRTQISLTMFINGLFPTLDNKLNLKENTSMPLISYNSVSLDSNRILTFPLDYCPKYQQLFRAYQQSPEGKAVERQYQPLYSYVSKKSGLEINSVDDLFILYFGLTTEKEWGLKLPQWTDLIYPDYLQHALMDKYKLLVATPALNRLNGGFLLKKIINDIHQKLNYTDDEPNMYVYSAHEMTIISILGALRLYYPHIPRYGACVVLELHEVEQNVYVKVLYNKYKLHEFVEMNIPGCQKMCLLENFVNLLQNHLPEDGDPCILTDKEIKSI